VAHAVAAVGAADLRQAPRADGGHDQGAADLRQAPRADGGHGQGAADLRQVLSTGRARRRARR